MSSASKQQPEKVEQQAGSGTRVVVASIVFNSFLQPDVAGVRGASDEPARQLVLRDEDFDIHIKIWRNEQGRQIRGQLLPRSGKGFAPPAECHLLHSGARFHTVSTNETGDFYFDEVPEGDLNLQVDLPGLTIVGSLDIQELH